MVELILEVRWHAASWGFTGKLMGKSWENMGKIKMIGIYHQISIHDRFLIHNNNLSIDI
jgi:hypothetical protein